MEKAMDMELRVLQYFLAVAREQNKSCRLFFERVGECPIDIFRSIIISICISDY